MVSLIVGIVLLSHSSVLADICGDELLKALKVGFMKIRVKAFTILILFGPFYSTVSPDRECFFTVYKNRKDT